MGVVVDVVVVVVVAFVLVFVSLALVEAGASVCWPAVVEGVVVVGGNVGSLVIGAGVVDVVVVSFAGAAVVVGTV